MNVLDFISNFILDFIKIGLATLLYFFLPFVFGVGCERQSQKQREMGEEEDGDLFIAICFFIVWLSIRYILLELLPSRIII